MQFETLSSQFPVSKYINKASKILEHAVSYRKKTTKTASLATAHSDQSPSFTSVTSCSMCSSTSPSSTPLNENRLDIETDGRLEGKSVLWELFLTFSPSVQLFGAF
jgi:hypothetical protein